MVHIGCVNVIAAIKQLLGVKSLGLEELNHADVSVQKLLAKMHRELTMQIEIALTEESTLAVFTVVLINIMQWDFVEAVITKTKEWYLTNNQNFKG